MQTGDTFRVGAEELICQHVEEGGLEQECRLAGISCTIENHGSIEVKLTESCKIFLYKAVYIAHLQLSSHQHLILSIFLILAVNCLTRNIIVLNDQIWRQVCIISFTPHTTS